MKNRIESLDSVRGIAALVVMIYHIVTCFRLFHDAKTDATYNNKLVEWLTVTPLHTFWAGLEAVILFFVLSGFVLAIPFLENRVSSYRDFIIKRFFRIYIPYIIVMLISSLFVTFFSGYKEVGDLSITYETRWDHDVSPLSIVSFFLMIPYDIANVNGVVWSLFHEMRISILFPLIMYVIIRFDWKKSLSICFAALLLAKLSLDFAASVIGQDIISKVLIDLGNTFYYAFFFVMGSTLCKYRGTIVAKVKGLNKIQILLMFMTALLLINNKWMYYVYNFKATFLNDFVPAIGIILLFIIVLSSTFADRVLRTRPLLWLGKVSYSLYLTHIITIMTVTIFLGKVAPTIVGFLVSPFIALPVAHLAYKYLEAPAIEWGKKLVNRNKTIETKLDTISS